MDIGLIFNPVIISVLLLCVLCVRKVNVLLSLIIAAIAAGVLVYVPIADIISEHWSFSAVMTQIFNIPYADIMNTFVSGMGGNSETALSYILLGTFAVAMMHTGLTKVLANKISSVVNLLPEQVRITSLSSLLLIEIVSLPFLFS